VVNGDSYVEARVEDLLGVHKTRASLVATRVPDVSRYGSLRIEGGRVAAFVEKGARGPGYINAGMYAFDRSVLEEMPGRGSLERDVLPNRKDISVLAGDFPFIDIGTPESLRAAEAFFASRKRA
jgi:NDP-sugar pyrophosphorylase family protein